MHQDYSRDPLHLILRIEKPESVWKQIWALFFFRSRFKTEVLAVALKNKARHLCRAFLFICDRDRIRTCDRLLRRQMLYPAELRDPGSLCAHDWSRTSTFKIEH